MAPPAQCIQDSLTRALTLPHRPGSVDPCDADRITALAERITSSLPDTAAFVTPRGRGHTESALDEADRAYREVDHARATAWLDHAAALLDANAIPGSQPGLHCRLLADCPAALPTRTLDRDPLVIDLVDRDWAATHTPALLRAWQRAITATGDYQAGRPAMHAIHAAKHWHPLLTALGPGVNDPRDLVPLAAALGRAAASGYDVAARLLTLVAAAPLPSDRPGREVRDRLLADCSAAKPADIPTQHRSWEHDPGAADELARIRAQRRVRRTTRTPPRPSPPPPRPGPAR